MPAIHHNLKTFLKKHLQVFFVFIYFEIKSTFKFNLTLC